MRLVITGLAMLRYRALFVAATTISLLGSSHADEFRTWTDRTGKYQREAKFQGRNEGSVTLLLRSGKSTTIPFDKLSKRDQDFVDGLFEKKGEKRKTFRQLLASAGMPKEVSELSPQESEACERIGKGIEAAISQGDDAISDWFDTTEMAKRSIEGLGVPANALETVIANTTTDITGALSAKVLAAKGRPKYLRPRRRNGIIQLEYRALDAVGAPGYFALMLGQRLADKLPVKDVFVYAAGETLTQTVRRGMMLVAAEANPEFGETLKGADAELMRSRRSLDRFNALLAENKKLEALNVLKELPRNKTLFYLRLAVASEIGGQEFIQACQEYENAFPNDTTLCFVCLSPSLMRGNSQQALLAAEDIEKQIGPDPYLDFIRGNLADSVGDSDKAIEFWIRALAAERGVMPAYESLRRKYLEQKDYEHVAEVIEFVEKEFNADLWDAVSNDNASKEFLSSAPGKRWRNSKTSRSAK
jgi:tetratricopeptide (TPR) repeat protein